ncbi:hypothetical protein [Okeania sp. KiyG1]|uniref:hypothetical protein n=1 Tax=Okeania sp. KiyG1 TaxID=2720165 RepID=UPI00192385F5|nr:hypothetical protein [Okeania sp. KiyG1]
MVYSKEEYQAREQDAPTAVPPNKHCRTMHHHLCNFPTTCFQEEVAKMCDIWF